MSLKAFLDGYRAARNGQSRRTDDPPAGPWGQDARPEWISEPPHGEAPEWGSEALPPESGQVAELEELLELSEAEIARLKDEHLRALVDCEVLRRDVAARATELAECQTVLSELNTEFTRVKETRDRYQTNGKRAAAARDAAQARIAQLEEQLAQLEKRLGQFKAVLKIAGAKKALVKLAHPDMHPNASPAERRALNETFQTLTAVFDEMESEE